MPDWQTISALACVALAAAAIARRALRLLRRNENGCGGCGTCPSRDAKMKSGANPPHEFVQLQVVQNARKQSES